MKLIFQFIIILFLLSPQKTLGQDTTSSILKNWTILKTQLQRRTNVVINLVQILNESNKVDKEVLTNLKIHATDIFIYLDTLKHFDSLSIDLTMKKYNTLNESLTKTIILIESRTKFNNQIDIINLMAQLNGAENRIKVARYEYNESCKAFNRPGLQFWEKGDAKAVKVEF